MGVRPENIHDEPVFTSTYPDACIRAHVELTELMGSETYLYLSTSGKEENFVARVDPRTTSHSGENINGGLRRQPPALFRSGNRGGAPLQGLIQGSKSPPLRAAPNPPTTPCVCAKRRG